MICPTCGWDNVPGNETCSHCLQDLSQLDRPVAQSRVERSLMEDPITVLQPRKPVMMPPTTSVADAMQTMLAADVGAVLVVDGDTNLLGIFSERDVLEKVASLHEDLHTLPVADFMTPNPETVTSTDPLNFALHKMDVGGYRHLPMLADGKPAGMISVRDMLRHLTRVCKNQK